MVSHIQPRAIPEWPSTDGPGRPIEVSISVVDRLTADHWVRGDPTVQVEGGAFHLTEIPELLRALLDVANLPTRATTPS
jgi:hypothetical protein